MRQIWQQSRLQLGLVAVHTVCSPGPQGKGHVTVLSQRLTAWLVVGESLHEVVDDLLLQIRESGNGVDESGGGLKLGCIS